MDNSDTGRQRKLAARIASTANDEEKEELRLWIEQLLELKAANLSSVQKAKKAIAVTASSKVVLPIVKIIAREMKRFTWDDRGLKGKLGIWSAVAGLAIFGGQGAGIAALGTAVGVPLWVVFGAGATFVGALYEEITTKKSGSKNNLPNN